MCGTVRRMFELKVKQITGEVLTVELENGTESFVHEVKAKIASLTGVESDRQRLIFTGRVLKDEDRLKDYGISNESMIQYVVRPQDTPIVPPNSTERASATTEPIVQQFRNLGNGVVMGSITLDSSNLSRENLPLQDIIGQVMNLAQTFLPPSNTTNRQNTPSSGHSQPIPQAESPRPQPLASSSIQITQSSPSSTQIHSPSESLAAAHLDAVLQLIPNQTSPTNPNLAAILNQLFRVLNALQVPIVNLSRDLPQTFNDSMVADLPGNTLTQMIQLSNMLRSLSAASFHLSNHFDRITGLNPPSTIMTTGGSPSITHPVAPLQSPLIASSSQAQHLTTNSQQGDVILEDVTLDEEVD